MNSNWRIEFLARAHRSLGRIHRKDAARIIRKLEEIAASGEPRATGKSLRGNTFSGLWRYRIGDYRAICRIEDEQLTVLIIEIGHRRDVYQQ